MSTEKRTFTLLELTSSIQRAIKNVYNNAYWVKAEMHKLNQTVKGHCYPELVHKENGDIVAEMRGTIWKNNFTSIRLRFEETVKEPLRDGLTLLFQVKVNFHPIYGMGLEIIDIDPYYTLGELHKEREATLKKLKEKGLLTKNQQLKLPVLPKNIAIISVESSKGLSDFLMVLKGSSYGFNTHLFPATLSGDGAIETILKQLEKIKRYPSFFDAVVIVRGGGGEVGMACYNNYQLCEAITNFPLPVLTGIGHSTNLTVAEMIAYRSAITPTELAVFFITTFQQFETSVKEMKRVIIDEAYYLLSATKKVLVNESRIFRNASTSCIISNKQSWRQFRTDLARSANSVQKDNWLRLRNQTQTFRSNISTHVKITMNTLHGEHQKLTAMSAKFLFEKNNYLQDYRVLLLNNISKTTEDASRKLTQIETTIKLVHPDNALRKGYTITLFNGKVLSEDNYPKEGDEIQTTSIVGTLKSKVEN